MTRLLYPPTKQPIQERTYTPTEDELRRIRHGLSMQAARVGMKGVRLADVVSEVEALLDRLRRLAP